MSAGIQADASGTFASLLLNGSESVRLLAAGIPASDIIYTPSGSIVASDVAAAIAELDGEVNRNIDFLGTIASAGLGTGGTLACSVVRNNGGFYNGTIFQPTVAGLYMLSVQGTFDIAAASYMGLSIAINGVSRAAQFQGPYAVRYGQVNAFCVAYMNGSSDTAEATYGASPTGGNLASFKFAGAFLRKL